MSSFTLSRLPTRFETRVHVSQWRSHVAIVGCVRPCTRSRSRADVSDKELRLKHRNMHIYVSANTSHVKLQKTSNFSIETLYRLRFGLMNDLGYYIV